MEAAKTLANTRASAAALASRVATSVAVPVAAAAAPGDKPHAIEAAQLKQSGKGTINDVARLAGVSKKLSHGCSTTRHWCGQTPAIT